MGRGWPSSPKMIFPPSEAMAGFSAVAVAVVDASSVCSPSGPRPMLTERAEERDALRWRVCLDDEASDGTDREGLEWGVTNASLEGDDRTMTPINEKIDLELMTKNFMMKGDSDYFASIILNVFYCC